MAGGRTVKNNAPLEKKFNSNRNKLKDWKTFLLSKK